tara:strand:- start:1867 stop:2529 length:663 start_codon:yes stop_codon:yes gene_type:complete
VTAALVFGAGAGSAAFNVHGAHGIYAGGAGLIFGFVVLCMEGLAITSLRHILTDFDNNNYIKSVLGSVAFSGIVMLCMYSGYRAFDAMSIDAQETNAFNLAKADRTASAAREYLELAEKSSGSNKETQLFYAEKKLKEENDIRIEVKKKVPPPFWAVLLILITLELVKMVGRFALATPSTKKWSLTRRRIESANAKAKLLEAKAAEQQARNNVTKLPMRG